MRFLSLFCMYFFAIICCDLLLSIEVSPIITFLFVFIYLCIFLIVPRLNILFWTQNIKKIDYFLRNNRQQILYNYSYALVNEEEDEQIALLQEIIQLRQHPNDEYYFKFSLALLNKNYSVALEEAEKIPNSDLRHYALAQLQLNLKNYDEATLLAEKIMVSWQKYFILAQLAKLMNDQMNIAHFTELAIQKTRGIDHYIVSHLLKKA